MPVLNWRVGTILVLVVLILALSLIASVWGVAPIPAKTVIKMVISKVPLLQNLVGKKDWADSHETILFKVRLPRILLAILVGAALATAGVIYQALFKNPMADPYIIGVSAGAALGATVGIMLKIGQSVLGIYLIPVLAFLGATATVTLVYQIARVGGEIHISSILLAGLAVSAVLSAIMSLLMISSGQDLHSIVFWLIGGFSAASWDQIKIALPLMIVALPFPFLYARELNVLLLGEERAQQLGVETETVKKILLVSASMVTAAAVSVSGLIAFVGLMTPHITRLIVGPEHRLLLPTALLSGALLLLLADTLARYVAMPGELPVGIITAILGGPFFLYLLKKKGRVF